MRKFLLAFLTTIARRFINVQSQPPPDLRLG